MPREPGDGSEDYDCDLEETLRNILAAKGLYDKDEGKFSAPLPRLSDESAGVREAPNLHWLVDWVHLYATEGSSWIGADTAVGLIALASREPHQADADHFKRGGSLKALQTESKT